MARTALAAASSNGKFKAGSHKAAGHFAHFVDRAATGDEVSESMGAEVDEEKECAVD